MKSNKQFNNKSKKFRKIKGRNEEQLQDLEDFINWSEKNIRDTTGTSFLHDACIKGDLNIVKILLNMTPEVENYLSNRHFSTIIDINDKDNYSNTPLNYACREGYMRIAKLLIDAGADVNNRGYLGVTPLHQLFEITIEGSFTFEPNNANYFYTCAKFLIDKGADVNAKDKNGDTPLHYHCRYTHIGKYYIVKALLENGADVYYKNNLGYTPLHINCMNIETMEDTLVYDFLIIKGADINVKDNQNKTPFEYIKDPKIREWFEKKIKDRKDANARILNSITTGEGKNRKLLAPNVLDNISKFAELDTSRPLTTESRKRSQYGRDRRNRIESLKVLNEKKVNGKLLSPKMLRKIREFDGTIDDEAIKVKRDDDLQKEIAFKNFGGKRKTKKNKNSKRKTRKH